MCLDGLVANAQIGECPDAILDDLFVLLYFHDDHGAILIAGEFLA